MKIKHVLKSVVVVVAIVVVLAIGWTLARAVPVGANAQSNNTQVITAVERQEQVVLLSTSTQGLSEENRSSTVFGKNLPGSERTEFVQYRYRAKLGIEGGDVKIKETGENRFLVTVPEFIVIGHDNANFDTALEDDGVLSWFTEDIDTAETITGVLDEGAMGEQTIDANRDLLEEQARVFYTGIINGIDNAIELEFEFKN